MRFAVAAVVAAAFAWAGGASAAQGKKIQCWNDKDGHKMCGDHVPPEYSAQKREVFEDGRVIETKKAAKTPEEIAADKRAKEEAEAAQKQAAYDRDLLETYRSVKDLESMRDERLALIDSRITSEQKNIEDTAKTLTDLHARAAKLEADKKPSDDKLNKQIKQYDKAQQNNQLALDRAKKERSDVETKFNADIARFNQLKGVPAAKPAAPAAAAAPSGASAAASAGAPAAAPKK